MSDILFMKHVVTSEKSGAYHMSTSTSVAETIYEVPSVSRDIEKWFLIN